MTVLLGVFQLLVEQLPDSTNKTRIKCFFSKKNFLHSTSLFGDAKFNIFHKKYLVNSADSLHGTFLDSSLLCFGTGVFSELQCSQHCQQINENEICIFQEDILLLCIYYVLCLLLLENKTVCLLLIKSANFARLDSSFFIS